MSRTLLIAANWKMNPIPAGALEHESPYQTHADVDIVVFPTFLDIAAVCAAGVITGGQCGRPELQGAHTGDVSMAMLKEAGCHYVLCGHSERRRDHAESDAQVAEQAIAAIEAGLHPVVCIGESKKERTAGKQEEVVAAQLQLLPKESDITIAYEPIWAIGTGDTATPDQAQEMHAFIRSQLPEDRREKTRILYGGSVKPENAEALLQQEDIDGGLVGGASLDPQAFGEIVRIAEGLGSD